MLISQDFFVVSSCGRGLSLRGRTGKPSAQLGLTFCLLCVFVSTLLGVGCESSRSDVSDSKQPDDSVKADFDWAMLRLRRAIETFAPSTSSGLSIKRELSYEFFPPDASQPDYTARVVVDSKMAYKPQRFYSTTDEERASAPQAADSAFTEELLAKRENDPTKFQGDLETGPSSKSTVIEPLVGAPSTKKRIVYELVYRDQRWQLETQPESKHEQMWFEYALQQ